MVMLRKTSPRTVRQNLARAKSAIRRDNIFKAIECTLAALRAYVPGELLATARFETEVLLEEVITDLNRSSGITGFFRHQKIETSVPIRYARGREDELVDRLETILHGLIRLQEETLRLEKEEEQARKLQLLENGRACLDKGQLPRGKSYLRRIVDEWGHEEGIMSSIGLIMLEYGLYFEAADVLSHAIRRFPADSKAWAGAIQAYKTLKEYEKAESLYLKGMKQFGRHPVTLLNLAKLYMDWRKTDLAYDYARLALERDPQLAEASDIVRQAEKKLFSR
jgi:tetratricopeptide (TPR) repeat protein